jgi:hypothetical protein
LGCNEIRDYCNPPSDLFFDVQASYLVRSIVRSLDEDIDGYIWYTLNGPGWRYTGLLNQQYQPMPSYQAYQTLAQELDKARFVGAVSYGEGVEAYAFRNAGEEVHVIWAIEDQTFTISVPLNRFIEAHSRTGSVIQPVYVNPEAHLTVGFSPIYVKLSP